MAIGALLIDLTGGRIETHFLDVFGSLAFLCGVPLFRRLWSRRSLVVPSSNHRAEPLRPVVFGVSVASMLAPPSTC